MGGWFKLAGYQPTLLARLARKAATRLKLDPAAPWIGAAVNACADLCPGQTDVVLASGPPYPAFAAAVQIARRLQAHAVLDYRDLWTGNPHYRHLKDKPFFEDVIKYLLGEYHDRHKVLAMVYWGKDAIKKVREIAGATNPEEADPVSIRGAYGRITTKGVYENVIHASSDETDAEREIKLWFKPDDVIVDVYPSKVATFKDVTMKVWA